MATSEATPMRESIHAKALRYLCEGRIRVRVCLEDDGVLEADVRGLGAVYTVAFAGGEWRCNCDALVKECCHVVAVKTITAMEPRR
jgi:hypothetical protein